MENETQQQKEESAMAPELNISIEGDNLKDMKKSLKSIKALILEGAFVFDNEGMKLISMDAANVAMIIYSVPKTDFTIYNIGETEKIGLVLADLVSNLNCFKKKVDLSIEGNKLRFTDGKYKFDQPLIELGETITKIPDIKFGVSIDMDGKFEEITHLLKRAGSVIFEVKDGKFNLKCDEDQKDGEVFVKEQEGSATGRYSSEYLTKIFDFGEVKKIEFGNVIPLKVTFKNSKLILAPRVDSD